MTPCLFNNSFEITYSPGANNQSFSSHLFYEDIIQISRCSLLKPECFITSDELLKTQNIMERLWALPDKADRPKIHMNELMCGGKDCNLVPNKDVREVIVGLSYACNMNCFHCMYEGHHFDTSLQKELYFHTLNAIKGNELNKITLTNKGEPFFYLSETMNYFRNFTKKDASCVSCITNGNCFGASQIEELSKISDSNGFSFNISFSVDAISEKTYNLVRTGGDFNKVIKNIELCVKYFGAQNVDISFTTKKPNLQEAFSVRDFYAHNFGIKTNITVDYYDKDLMKKFVVS